MYKNGVFVSAREDMPPMRLNDAVRYYATLLGA
jgi:hypothetical protein